MSVVSSCSCNTTDVLLEDMLGPDVSLTNLAVIQYPCSWRRWSLRYVASGICMSSRRQRGRYGQLELHYGRACIVYEELAGHSMSPVKTETHKGGWKRRRNVRRLRNTKHKHKTENGNTQRCRRSKRKHTKETETGSGLRGMCGGCATQQHSSTNVLLPSQNTKHKRWLWQQHLVLTQAHKTQNCFKKENTMSSLEECGQPVCIMQASTT